MNKCDVSTLGMDSIWSSLGGSADDGWGAGHGEADARGIDEEGWGYASGKGFLRGSGFGCGCTSIEGNGMGNANGYDRLEGKG